MNTSRFSIGLIAVLASLASAARPTTQPVVTAVDIDELPLKGDAVDAPKTRMGGAGRSAGSPEVYLLAPLTVGLTIREQPSIYWYLSAETSLPVEVIIAVPDQPDPVARQLYAGAKKPGLYRMDFREQKATLALDKEYQVTVAIAAEGENPGPGTFSTAMIKRVAAPAEVTPDAKDPAAFARAGLWHDAMDAISRKIEADPANKHLRNQRLDLLKKGRVFLSVLPTTRPSAAMASVLARAEAAEKRLLEEFAANDGGK